MNKKKSRISTIILILMLIVGLSVMLYPIVSNWWNERIQTKVIANYDKSVDDLSKEDYSDILKRAQEYNKKLAKLESPLTQWEDIPGYEDILSISGSEVMGYVTIPKISVELPVYHGTSAEVLNVAVGHLPGSSVPVGGAGTHAVISAHRGLPSAKLFTDIDQLAIGDEFTITVLNEIYTYEVDKISIVLPEDTKELAIEKGKDYVTLMTCTPYGVNTHRLLVRGHRVDTVYPHNIKVSAEATQVDPMIVVPVIMAPILLIMLIYWIFGGKRKNSSEEDFDENALLILEDIKKRKGG